MVGVQNNPTIITTNIFQKIRCKEDIFLLKRLVVPWIGELCWWAKLGYGDELILHSGRRMSYGNSKLSPLEKGAWIFGTRASMWELESSSQMITNARENLEEIKVKIKVIENKPIASFTIHYPELITTLGFEDEYYLKIYPDNDNYDLPYWELFTPDDKVIKLESKSSWSYAPSNIFLAEDRLKIDRIYTDFERISSYAITKDNVEYFYQQYLYTKVRYSGQKILVENLIAQANKGVFLVLQGLHFLNQNRNSNHSILLDNAIFYTFIYKGFEFFIQALFFPKITTFNHSVFPETPLKDFVNIFAIDLQKYRLDAASFREVLATFDPQSLIKECLEKENFSLVDLVKLSQFTNQMIDQGLGLEKTANLGDKYGAFIENLACALGLCLVIACETISLFTENTLENPP